MKLSGFIFLMAMIACGQVKHTESEVAKESQSTDSAPRIELPTEQSSFPEWLRQMYPEKLQLEYRTISQKLTSFKKVNDSVSFCTSGQMDGVCATAFLKTYVNSIPKDSLGVGKNCDHDLSTPSHSWKVFELTTSNTILISEYTKSVHDSLVGANGRIKEGYDFLEAETNIDTAKRVFTIGGDGVIKAAE